MEGIYTSTGAKINYFYTKHGVKKPLRSLIDRLHDSYIQIPGITCWIWSRAYHKQGYGVIRIGGRDGKFKLAHRVSYETFIGDIPEGMNVLHKCDITSCINPQHLFLGMQIDNIRDMFKKGRFNSANKKKTHCLRNHLLIGNNLYLTPDGRRGCKSCRKATNEKYKGKYGTS